MASGFLPGTSRQSGMSHQPAWLLAVVLLAASAMGARLAWLQLAQGPENRPAGRPEPHPAGAPSPCSWPPARSPWGGAGHQPPHLQPLPAAALVSQDRWPALRDRLSALLGCLPSGSSRTTGRDSRVMRGIGSSWRTPSAVSRCSASVNRLRLSMAPRSTSITCAPIPVAGWRPMCSGTPAASPRRNTSASATRATGCSDRMGRTGLESALRIPSARPVGRSAAGGECRRPGAAGARRQAGRVRARICASPWISSLQQHRREGARLGCARGPSWPWIPSTGAIRAMASRPSLRSQHVLHRLRPQPGVERAQRPARRPC
jgi:penicillin-binding protein 2